MGNTRVVFCDKNNNGKIEDQTEILQETHYYPFGMAFNGAWYADNTASKNKYLYNGKELNEDFGLNMSDYGARWYDASIGRWWNVDPLAAAIASNNPYNYVLNNPLSFIDPDGMESVPAASTPAPKAEKEPTENEKTSTASDAAGLASFYERGNSKPDDYWKRYWVNGQVSRVEHVSTFGGNTDFVDEYNEDLCVPCAGYFMGRTVTPVSLQANTSEVWQPYRRGIGFISGGFGASQSLNSLIDIENVVTLPVAEFKMSGLGLALLLRTSSKGTAKSIVYTIYEANGAVWKYGVSDAAGRRLAQSLIEAPKGFTFRLSSTIMTKQEAHISEKYLTSLYYNTMKKMPNGMKRPYPIDFSTGKRIKP